MKYGEYLKNHMLKKWKHFYVDYDLLKKTIKHKNHKQFWNIIQNELSKINIFYKHLKENNECQKELNDYVILNYMSFFKAIKKYDKKLCKNKKIEFFKMIELEEFYKTFLSEERFVNPTKLVIFDKDGTLIYIEKIFVKWFQKTVSNMIDIIDDLDEFYIHMGYNKKTNYFDSNSELAKGTSDDVKNAFKSYFLKKFPEKNEEEIFSMVAPRVPIMEIKEEYIEPCGDLKKIFMSLKRNNIKIAVCTSDNRYQTIKTLKILGLHNMIDCIVCGDDPISSKPSPEPIWKICNELNVTPCETIMVGDTIADVHAGINSKCGKIIGVLTGGYETHDLQNADIILKSVDSITNHIVKENIIYSYV